jgi:hypothetical protein
VILLVGLSRIVQDGDGLGLVPLQLSQARVVASLLTDPTELTGTTDLVSQA